MQVNTWVKSKLFLFLKYDFEFEKEQFDLELKKYKQWLKSNPIQSTVYKHPKSNKTLKWFAISNKQSFSTDNSVKLAKWLSTVKVERSLIAYKKDKLAGKKRNVYHFLALDYYWHKQAIKHRTKQSN
jgi:hypothetical protein